MGDGAGRVGTWYTIDFTAAAGTLCHMKTRIGAILLIVLACRPGSTGIGMAATPYETDCAAIAEDSSPDAERLHALFDRAWEYRMTEYPEAATYSGVPGHNDRWTDLSPASIERRKQELHAPLRTLLSINRDNLDAADQLSYDLFKHNYEQAIEGTRFPGEYLRITQLGGVHQGVADMIRVMPRFTMKDYQDIVARLNGVGAVVDQTIALLEKGLAKGITPPKITLRDVVDQVDAQLVADPADSPILETLVDFPDTLPAADRERWHAAAVEAVRETVLPAYRRLRDYLAETYIPQSRETIATSDLPDGAAWYAFDAKASTTTDLTPQEIHDIGLAEVKRLRVEMERTIRACGFEGTRDEFIAFLRTDSQFYFTDKEDLLTAYRDACKRVDPELLKLFAVLPRQPYGVKAVPAYAEKSQPAAYFQPGSTRAGRPAYFYANTYDLPSRPKWEIEALVLHEAVPGHHLQLALADELEAVPEFQKRGGYTAFVEGWALYAEGLGYEMDMYADPYSRFGQLAMEMWRAVRLVVDTGMHALGWSRQEAIDYFLENGARSEHDTIVEVDRYIVWPGQALAYKIGQLKIKALREYAAAELGEKFNVRDFHDKVLGSGALPLSILEDRIHEWVALEQSAGE